MRHKFFLIVFAFLLASIVVVSTLQAIFFQSERLYYIDQRLEALASSLIASGLSLQMIQNLESTDDLISDLLGEERVDHIINVYSLEGKVLVQNFTALEIPLTFDLEPHQSVKVNGETVRVLNVKHNRLLVQVGVLLEPAVVNRLSLINPRFLLFTILIFGVLLVAAYFSSLVLFRPLRRLTGELSLMSAQLDRKLGQPLSGFVIGNEITRLARRPNSKDDFEKLCAEIESFLRQLEGYTRTFNAQTAILTHELKTPLTILKNYLQDLKRAPDLASARALGARADEEIGRLTGLIDDYLRWSVLTSNPGRPDEIYKINLSEIVTKAVSDLNSIYEGRLQLELRGPAVIFAMPDHARQLVNNLLSNALRYSRGEVACVVDADYFEVRDQGGGLPSDVLQHLGSPFNRGAGDGAKSSGLGLAWVASLCDKYEWQLKIDTDSRGTVIRVDLS